jgi:thiamine-phosphate pyrophosphorylase
MTEPPARLYLLSPVIADAESFAPRLAEACGAGGIAAVLLRFAETDERTLVKHVKALAPVVHECGAAAVIAAGGAVDLAAVAVRGGADGLHTGAGPAEARHLREHLRDRIFGAGNIRSRHDAMEFGEAGVDYVMFGEPRADGSLPLLEAVAERAAWWAEIFVTPCVAYAPSLEAVSDLVRTRAEFIAIGEAVWSHPDGPAAAVTAAAERCAAEAAG